MADKHPYVQGPGNLIPVISQLRKSFPSKVTADTLKKLGFAPKNETYVINVMRFLGLIDPDGNRTDKALRIFTLHDEKNFAKEFSKLVEEAYVDLFELHKNSAWTLDSNSLINFFRTTDGSTDIVGKRQSLTFQLLCSLSGHGEISVLKTRAGKKNITKEKTTKPLTKVKKTSSESVQSGSIPILTESKAVGLTVRIEINLPADGDQETYDRIFRSIRKNLLNE